MRLNARGPYVFCGVVLSTILAAPRVIAEAADVPDEATTPDTSRLQEVVVTAQKREQSINDVGLTIQAASASDLQSRGIESIEDLPKLVPGLTYTKSIFSTPVFTLRGVGLYDATWGAAPSVAVYTDQMPRNFPVMSDALDLDVQRVEVLKGPQGTLFGQSATGGAVNYVLNKPTKDFQATASAAIERFDKQILEAALSGPITDTLRARFAIKSVQGGAWQFSETRPYDENGDERQLMGRLTVAWQPTDQLLAEGSVTAVRDRSDPQAPQFAGSLLNIYSAAALAAANANPATRNPYGVVNDAAYAALTNPASPGYNVSFLGQQAQTVALLNGINLANPAAAIEASHQAGALAYLSARDYAPNSRAADWTPGLIGASHNTYYQGTLRLDYKLNDELTATSLSAFAHKTIQYGQDLDATPASVGDVPLHGNVRAFNEELHLSGTGSDLNWIVGGDFDDSHTAQDNYYDLRDYASNAYGGIPCIATALVNPNACKPGIYGGPYAYINITENDFSSKSRSYAGFGNLDYKFNSNLSAHAGVRFTNTRQTATYCYNDPLIDLNQGTNFIFSNVVENPTVANGGPQLTAGQCFPPGDGNLGTIKGRPTITPLTPPALDENNTSFRVGTDYKLDQGTLLYLSVSRGYKAGLFSEIGASATSEYTPAKQEKLVDYEAGFKAPLLDRRMNINGAVFYYQYSDKQVRARVNDPTYGLLEKVVNIPKSRVLGAEMDIQAVPFTGLNIALAGTYLSTKVTSDFATTPDGVAVYNAEGYTGNFKNSTLPFSPKFSATFDTEYEWNMPGGWSPFVGSTVLYQGRENTTFSNSVLQASDFEIRPYTTLDVRTGVRSSDNKYTLTVYCHNITSKYYVNSISFYLDSFERFTAQPAVYGVNVRVNF